MIIVKFILKKLGRGENYNATMIDFFVGLCYTLFIRRKHYENRFNLHYKKFNK